MSFQTGIFRMTIVKWCTFMVTKIGWVVGYKIAQDLKLPVGNKILVGCGYRPE